MKEWKNWAKENIWKRNMAGIGVVWLVNSDLSIF